MTPPEVITRLFSLALLLEEREKASAYSRIADVKGSGSWRFLEHLSELPEEGRGDLLHALIKRRFALEGLRSVETAISAPERLEIEHWLKHNNSMHGTRAVQSFAFSVREEEFAKRKASLALASRAGIREAFRDGLTSIAVPIKFVRDTRQEIRWFAMIDSDLRVDGWVDLGKSGEQASSFVAVRDSRRTLHAPTSLLGLMGIGETSWEFLEEGQEELCSAATFRFFAEICAVMGTPPRADERARTTTTS